jgi:hypothetical protein
VRAKALGDHRGREALDKGDRRVRKSIGAPLEGVVGVTHAEPSHAAAVPFH